MRHGFLSIVFYVSLLALFGFARAEEPLNADSAEDSLKATLEDFQDSGLPDEILFAVRKPSIDGHWYGNISYYSFDENKFTFPKAAAER